MFTPYWSRRPKTNSEVPALTATYCLPSGLEGRRAILKELLLPAVEDRRLQPQFVTELGNRLLLQQMPPQKGDLLFRRVVLPCLFHAFSPLS
jgi:hypothetical protein